VIAHIITDEQNNYTTECSMSLNSTMNMQHLQSWSKRKK